MAGQHRNSTPYSCWRTKQHTYATRTFVPRRPRFMFHASL
jgi:hypothetical protein